MTCIGCPMGCQLEVSKNDAGELVVTGATCARGVVYGKQEATAPMRVVTALVRVEGRNRPLCVKTASAVPKEKIPDVLAVLAKTVASATAKLGETILPDVCGTGVAIVATANA